MKQKWLDAINVSKTPNFKTAYICSDHFDAESFFHSDELRQRKRLCKDAVPKQKNQNLLNLSRENEAKETAIIRINNCEVSDVTEDISIEANISETEMCTNEVSLKNSLEFQEMNVLKDVSLQSHFNEDVEICTNEIFVINSIDSHEGDVSEDINLQSSTEKVTETYIQELSLNNSEMLNGSTPSSESNSNKR